MYFSFKNDKPFFSREYMRYDEMFHHFVANEILAI